MSRVRSALFSAVTISVDCPHCGEPLPALCGSIFWTIGEISKAIAESPNRTCDGCDEPFVIRQQNSATLGDGGGK